MPPAINGVHHRFISWITDLLRFIQEYKGQLLQNSFWLGFGEMTTKLFMFIVTIQIIRYFQPHDYGKFSIAVAAVNTLAVILDMGLPQIIIRNLSKDQSAAPQYLSNILSLKVILGVVYFLILFFFYQFSDDANWRLILLSLGFVTWAQDMAGVFIYWFIAREHMRKVFYIQFINYGGMLVSAITTVYFDFGMKGLLSGYVLSSLIGLALAFLITRRDGIHIQWTIHVPFILSLLRQSTPLFGMVLVGSLYSNLDTLMIGHFKGETDVAYYQASYKMLFAIQGLSFFSTAVFPRLSILAGTQSRSVVSLNWIVLAFIILFMVPAAYIGTVFAEEIILLIYGSKMLPTVFILTVFIWIGVVNLIKGYLINFFIAYDRQYLVFLMTLITMICDFFLDLYLIPIYSYTAAAFTLLASESAIVIMMLVSQGKKRKHTSASYGSGMEQLIKVQGEAS